MNHRYVTRYTNWLINKELKNKIRFSKPRIYRGDVASVMGISTNQLNYLLKKEDLDTKTKARITDAIDEAIQMKEHGETIKKSNSNKDMMRETLFHVDLAVGDAQVELEDMEHMEAVKECLGLARAYIKELERIIQ